MDFVLSANEVRVLGALLEKERTTPDYYPLTMNALIAACNQKSNRDPVVNLDEAAVSEAVESLKERKLVWLTMEAGSRSAKFRHDLLGHFEFSPEEVALLCVLFLRGPQTPGELRSRTGRLCEFRDLEHVERTLDELNEWAAGPFVVKLSREPGRREARYAHLFGGEVGAAEAPAAMAPPPTAATAAAAGGGEERLAALEATVAELRGEVEALQRGFAEFRRQFE